MTAAAPQNRGGNMGTEFTEVEYRINVPEVVGSNPTGSYQPSRVPYFCSYNAGRAGRPAHLSSGCAPIWFCSSVGRAADF